MSKTKVYIDGQSGTTGLQIYDRIGQREDIELLRIDDDKRHDIEERRKFLNAADVVFLCLPDDGAREAVSLVENPDVIIIDASTAHRTSDDWTYGYPELSKDQRSAIASSKRIANPGCYATGFISTVGPLVKMGIVPTDYPAMCVGISGYSGGGKKMIASYEAEERDPLMDSPKVYGLTTQHKHVPEMQKLAGLDFAPAFTPVVDDYLKGMGTIVSFHNRLLNGAPTAEQICARMQEYYADEHFVTVEPFSDNPPAPYTNTYAGTNKLHIIVAGNQDRTTITALFDNLGKGASGAAVQNMNIALGLDETVGLE